MCLENETFSSLKIEDKENDFNPVIIFKWLDFKREKKQKQNNYYSFFDVSNSGDLLSIFLQYKKSNVFIRNEEWTSAIELLSLTLQLVNDRLEFFYESGEELSKNINEFLDYCKLQALHRLRIVYCLLQHFDHKERHNLNSGELKKIYELINESKVLQELHKNILLRQNLSNTLKNKFLKFQHVCQFIYHSFNLYLLGLHHYLYKSIQKTTLILRKPDAPEIKDESETFPDNTNFNLPDLDSKPKFKSEKFSSSDELKLKSRAPRKGCFCVQMLPSDMNLKPGVAPYRNKGAIYLRQEESDLKAYWPENGKFVSHSVPEDNKIKLLDLMGKQEKIIHSDESFTEVRSLCGYVSRKSKSKLSKNIHSDQSQPDIMNLSSHSEIVHPVWNYDSDPDENVEKIITRKSLSNQTDEKKIHQNSARCHEWVAIKAFEPVFFSHAVNNFLLELMPFCSANRIKILFKGGAPRDIIYGFPIHDFDMDFILPSEKQAEILATLNNLLLKLGGRKSQYIENLYVWKQTDIPVEIKVVTHFFNCDFLINSFGIIPNYENRIFKGTFCFNKQYFLNEEEAVAYIEKKELITPTEAREHLEEDITRILRGLHLNLSPRSFVIGKKLASVFKQLSHKFDSNSLVEDLSTTGRILAQLRKINKEDQIAYLQLLKKYHLLHHLFAAYEEKKVVDMPSEGIAQSPKLSFEISKNLQRSTYLKFCKNHVVPTFLNLKLLISKGLTIDFLYKIHTYGCGIFAYYEKLFIAIVNPFIFKKRGDNFIALLNFRAHCPLLTSDLFLKPLIDSDVINTQFSSIVFELRWLLLNFHAEKNFILLLNSGFLKYLFSAAYQLIIKKTLIFNFIRGKFVSTQMMPNPSLNFLLCHFLALEAVDCSIDNLDEIGKLYNGKYSSIISGLKDRFHGLLVQLIVSIKDLAKENKSNPAKNFNHQGIWRLVSRNGSSQPAFLSIPRDESGVRAEIIESNFKMNGLC